MDRKSAEAFEYTHRIKYAHVGMQILALTCYILISSPLRIEGTSMLKPVTGLLRVFVLMLWSVGSVANAYDYPITDPYAATVIGTPPEYAYAVAGKVPVRNDTIEIFPDRTVPDVLWNLKKLRYSYVAQDRPAPLIFMIAGTGASYQSPKMLAMQRTFWQAGYHVVSISSPTHPNFIVAASASSVPGHLVEDSEDIYRVMEAIRDKLQQKKVEATAFYLTGYSLGAAQSAFVAKLDEQKKSFNFQRVLLINPPVSLYNSVMLLDGMLAKMPGGMNNFDAFYKGAVAAVADVYRSNEDVHFDSEFLFDAFKYGKLRNDTNLEVLIGASFRISSENMAFATDVMTEAGYVVPKGLKLGKYDNITGYARILSRLSFLDYFNGIFVPHFQAGNPGLTAEALIEQMSLRSIEPYLRSSRKIGLLGNEDDIILGPGEAAYLRDVFGSRAEMLPHGGHCGNMSYPYNVKAMLQFFATPSTAGNRS